jgi:hypothetical protein
MTNAQIAAIRRRKAYRLAVGEAESAERMAQRLAREFAFEDPDDAPAAPAATPEAR